MLTIGQLAKQAGVGGETIRFYEREGILAEPIRSTSGYRQYGPLTVERVLFIRRAQLLGFQLKEIKELLELRDHPGMPRSEVRAKAVGKLTDIDARIRDLKAIRADLTRLVAACDGEGAAAGCPILGAMDGVHRAPPNLTHSVPLNGVSVRDIDTALDSAPITLSLNLNERGPTRYFCLVSTWKTEKFLIESGRHDRCTLILRLSNSHATSNATTAGWPRMRVLRAPSPAIHCR